MSLGNPLANQISLLLGRGGVAITPTQLIANAAQIATMPDTLYLPALAWAVGQVLAVLPSFPADGFTYTGIFGVNGPSFTPPSNGAIATDSVTQRQWTWINNAWN